MTFSPVYSEETEFQTQKALTSRLWAIHPC